MEGLLDPKFLLSLTMFICSIVAFCIIKFNDFAHLENNQKAMHDKLEKRMDKIDTKQDSFYIALTNIANDVSYLRGIEDARQARK